MTSSDWDWLCGEMESRQQGIYVTGRLAEDGLPGRWTVHLRGEDLKYDLGHGETPQEALTDLRSKLEDTSKDEWEDLI